MIVLVTGGRGYADKEFLYEVLDSIHNRAGISMVIHGAANGADSLAGNWARERGVQEVVCPANWNKHGRRAGYVRNSAMADILEAFPVTETRVVMFPGGTGTNMMKEIAEERDIQVIDALNHRR